MRGTHFSHVISEAEFKRIRPRPKIHATKVKVSRYSGEEIPVKGKCLVKVTHKDKVHTLTFIVVPKKVQPLLGLYACEKLNLVKRVLVVEADDYTNYEDLTKEYSDLFQGLGCLPGEHTIRLNNSVPPVIHPCCKVPCALRKRLKDELDRMEKLEVIEKIDEPTQWVSSLVIVEKRNRKPRVCMDPRDLNRAILREHFKLPTREEIMSQFANAKYFS